MSPTVSQDDILINHFYHLIRDDYGKVQNALKVEQVETWNDLRELLRDPNVINSLKWKDKDDTKIALSTIFKKKLRFMESFINYCQNSWAPLFIDVYDITLKSADDFDAFMSFGLNNIKYDSNEARKSYEDRTKTRKGSRLDLWNKQTIRKGDDFPYFKKAEQWSKFCSNFKLTADVQNLSEVLDPRHVPSNQEDASIFKLQSTFIYSVLNEKVQVPAAVTLVRKFRDTTDGQKAWGALVNKYENEQQGDTRRETLYKLITTQNIPERIQKPYYSNYIAEFTEWYREHNELAPAAELMNEDTLLVNLRRFLQNVPEIASCKNTIRTFKHIAPSTGQVFTAATEIAILTNFVTQLDDDAAIAQTTPRVLRKTYNANMLNQAHTIDEYDPSDYEQHFDTFYSPYEANASSSDYGSPHGRLPSSGYNDLSNDGKKAWRRMSVADRHIIIQSIAQEVDNLILEEIDDIKSAPSSKPPPPTASRSAMKTPISKGSRVNQVEYVPVDNNNEERQVTMSIRDCIKRGPISVNSAHTLPPEISSRVVDLSKHDSHDPRKMMSTSNTIELARKPITSPSAIRPSNPTTTALPDAPTLLQQHAEKAKPNRLSKIKHRLWKFV